MTKPGIGVLGATPLQPPATGVLSGRKAGGSASFQPVDRLNVVHAAVVPLVAKPGASWFR
jgi:hypothetical protein